MPESRQGAKENPKAATSVEVSIVSFDQPTTKRLRTALARIKKAKLRVADVRTGSYVLHIKDAPPPPLMFYIIRTTPPSRARVRNGYDVSLISYPRENQWQCVNVSHPINRC